MYRLVIEIDDFDYEQLMQDTVQKDGELFLPNLRNGKSEGCKVKVIENRKTVENITEKVAAIRGALDELKQSGFSYQVLRSYVRDKYKISYADFDTVMSALDDFFRGLK